MEWSGTTWLASVAAVVLSGAVSCTAVVVKAAVAGTTASVARPEVAVLALVPPTRVQAEAAIRQLIDTPAGDSAI